MNPPKIGSVGQKKIFFIEKLLVGIRKYPLRVPLLEYFHEMYFITVMHLKKKSNTPSNTQTCINNQIDHLFI